MGSADCAVEFRRRRLRTSCTHYWT